MKKVLLIEDSKNDAEMVKSMFEDSGIEIYTAATGRDGLKKAEEIKPDLIILDLVLPDISGFEVCRSISGKKASSGMIIVILSIKDDVDCISKAFEAGADDYIIKPPMPEHLVKKIRLYLGMR